MKSIYFKGNAPSFDLNVFYGYHTTTIYYLPGTTGWGALFSGSPTAILWDPRILLDPSTAAATNGFAFAITNGGTPDVVIEACANLSKGAWLPVATNTLSDGTAHYGDLSKSNHSARFYRVRMP